MIAVFDTGPLIALAKVDQLPLIKVMFREIVVPEAVHRELLAKVGSESRRLDVAMHDFVQIRSL
jgi:predicted nucleic acid-binding protein